MEQVVVKRPAAPLRGGPEAGAVVHDEVLFGMVAGVLAKSGDGWLQVKVGSGYIEGWIHIDDVHGEQSIAAQWAGYGKLVARSPWLDVLAKKDAASARLAEMPRGGLVHPLGGDEDGWTPVGLPGGEKGYVRSGNLMPQLTNWKVAPDEGKLREALATTALSYLGAQYRYGGSTPMGIDSSALVAMAYLLNGAVIWRWPEFGEGCALHLIEREKLDRGDVLYFEDHMALYLGDDMFVHATNAAGSDGVVMNSLRADSPFYRADLDSQLKACASLF